MALAPELLAFRGQFAAAQRLLAGSPSAADAEKALGIFEDLLTKVPADIPTDDHGKRWVIDHASPDGAVVTTPTVEDGVTTLPKTWTSLEARTVDFTIRHLMIVGGMRALQGERDAAARAKLVPVVARAAQAGVDYVRGRLGYDDWLAFYAMVLADTSETAEAKTRTAEVFDEVWKKIGPYNRTANLFERFGLGGTATVLTTRAKLLREIGRGREIYRDVYAALATASEPVRAALAFLQEDPEYHDEVKDLRAASDLASQKTARENAELDAKVAKARARAGDELMNADHRFVITHRDALVAIKAALIEQDVRSGREAPDKPEKKRVKPVDPDLIDDLERDTRCRLPDSYKAFLLAIGELGVPYLRKFVFTVPKKTALKTAAKPSPIDDSNTAPILAKDGIAARYFLDAKGFETFEKAGALAPGDTLARFALPKGTKHRDGTLLLGPSASHDELVLMVTGPHAGEVWIDSLGNDAFSAFGPAAREPAFLTFVLNSLLRVDQPHAYWIAR